MKGDVGNPRLRSFGHSRRRLLYRELLANMHTGSIVPKNIEAALILGTDASTAGKHLLRALSEFGFTVERDRQRRRVVQAPIPGLAMCSTLSPSFTLLRSGRRADRWMPILDDGVGNERN